MELCFMLAALVCNIVSGDVGQTSLLQTRAALTLRAVQDEEKPPWMYWDFCGGSSYCPHLQPYGSVEGSAEATDRFLIFDSHGAGFNNERHSLELAFALAFLWNRTLVLPPHLGFWGDTRHLYDVNETWDVAALSEAVHVMPAAEFVNHVHAHPDDFGGGRIASERLAVKAPSAGAKPMGYQEWNGWFEGVEKVAVKVLEKFDPNSVVIAGAVEADGSPVHAEANNPEGAALFNDFAHNRAALTLNAETAAARALWIPPRVLLGNFYTSIFVADSLEAWRVRQAVRRSVHIRTEYFEAAAAAMKVAGISPSHFGAMHIRQDDWNKAYPHFYWDSDHPDSFLTSEMKGFLGAHGHLYLALKYRESEAKGINEKLIPTLRSLLAEPKQVHVLQKETKEAAAAVAGDLKLWDAMVDMAICAQASTFVGSIGSTFTGYIHRLRGYMPAVADKRLLYYDSAYNQGLFPSWAKEGVTAGDISWVREWPEGFDF